MLIENDSILYMATIDYVVWWYERSVRGKTYDGSATMAAR